MRKWTIGFFLFLTANILSAQVDIGVCARNVFINADSITKAGGQPLKEWEDCILRKKVPDFNVITLAGDTIQSSTLKGKILVINFWFIDCHPCIAELDGLNKLVAQYIGKDVVFLAITWEAKERIVKDFLPRHQLDFNIISDARVLTDQLMGSAYPTTYIIDQSGFIQYAWMGGKVDEKAGNEFYQKAFKAIRQIQNAE